MLDNVLWACAFVLACIAFYKFGLPVLKRFDAENVARIRQQDSDISDADAHFRHAMDVADEQVESVQTIRTGAVEQYLFEAEIFATRADAEEKRAERVGSLARRFYQELPAALAGAPPSRGRMSARERAAKRWSGRDGETLH